MGQHRQAVVQVLPTVPGIRPITSTGGRSRVGDTPTIVVGAPRMAPGVIEPPYAGSKPAALSTELRGRSRSVCPTSRRYPVRVEVAVAQLVEPRVVVPVVAGSSPVRHPSSVSAGEHPANREYSRPR